MANFNALDKTLSTECKYTHQDYGILSGDSVQFGTFQKGQLRLLLCHEDEAEMLVLTYQSTELNILEDVSIVSCRQVNFKTYAGTPSMS